MNNKTKGGTEREREIDRDRDRDREKKKKKNAFEARLNRLSWANSKQTKVHNLLRLRGEFCHWHHATKDKICEMKMAHTDYLEEVYRRS